MSTVNVNAVGGNNGINVNAAEDAMADIADRAAADVQSRVAWAKDAIALGKRFLDKDNADRAWMCLTGGTIADLLCHYCIIHGWGSKERSRGIEDICAAIAKECGEDHSGEVYRCLSIFHANEWFTRGDHGKARNALGARFLSFSANIQKGFGLLFKRELVKDEGAEKQREVYSVIGGPRIDPADDDSERMDMTDSLWLLMAIAVSEAATPSHLKGKLPRIVMEGKGKKVKEDIGMAHGLPFYNLCSQVNAFCKGKGENPLTHFVAQKEKSKGGDKGKDKPGAGAAGKGGDQNATGNRPEGQKPTVILDIKQKVASGHLVEALGNSEKKQEILYEIGRNKDVDADSFVASIITGMGDADKLDDLKKLYAFVGQTMKRVEEKRGAKK